MPKTKLTREQITEAAKIMLMMRRRKYERTIRCEGCGKETHALHSLRRFCSRKCRNRWYYHAKLKPKLMEKKKVAGVNPTTNAGGDVS